MLIGSRLRLAVLSLVALQLIALTVNCTRSGKQELATDQQAQAEPFEYTAEVVHTVEVDGQTNVTVSRIARSGALFREEWTQGGEKLATILRPDIGKSFFLWISRKEYSEVQLGDAAAATSEFSGVETDQNGSSSTPVQRMNSKSIEDQDLPRSRGAFEGVVSPTSTETRRLADETIDGHPCSVWEETLIFSIGHTEVTRVYRAADLRGLAVRLQNETTGQAGTTRVTTGRRNISTEVSADEFVVPVGYRKTANPN